MSLTLLAVGSFVTSDVLADRMLSGDPTLSGWDSSRIWFLGWILLPAVVVVAFRRSTGRIRLCVAGLVLLAGLSSLIVLGFSLPEFHRDPSYNPMTLAFLGGLALHAGAQGVFFLSLVRSARRAGGAAS